MHKKLAGLAAAALTGLFVLSTGVEPAVAAHGGGGGGMHGGGGGHFGGSGAHFGGGGHSSIGSVGRSIATPGRSMTGARVYGYQAGVHRGHGRRIIGVPYGSYGYGYYSGSCAYDYNRAVATGSPYWWNRYQDCID
jgi:hypothetical protein